MTLAQVSLTELQNQIFCSRCPLETRGILGYAHWRARTIVRRLRPPSGCRCSAAATWPSASVLVQGIGIIADEGLKRPPHLKLEAVFEAAAMSIGAEMLRRIQGFPRWLCPFAHLTLKGFLRRCRRSLLSRIRHASHPQTPQLLISQLQICQLFHSLNSSDTSTHYNGRTAASKAA
jgi:hypothetical protein